MPEKEKKISDLILDVLNNSGKLFMPVKTLLSKMKAETRRELGIYSKPGEITSSQIQEILEPKLIDKFVFTKKGSTLYILVPCDPTDVILSQLSAQKGKSPKEIARVTPFTLKECSVMFNDLSKNGSIYTLYNDELVPRIFLAENPVKEKPVKVQAANSAEYTQEKFIEAFKALDEGDFFVRICDLRKYLSWPREVFDDMLKNLRSKGIIHLYVGDESFMTPEEIQDCFIDENNIRMGTVTL